MQVKAEFSSQKPEVRVGNPESKIRNTKGMGLQSRTGNPRFLFAACFLMIVAGVWITSSTAQQKPSASGLSSTGPVVHGSADDPLRDPREAHLRHVQQLTFGGQNAEAYFNPDGKRTSAL